jgi:glycosyltransferase involved in cell wall biosynthesis
MTIVSIIIPCYNSEKTISECLESILKNELKNIELEIITVDNNSTDETKNIISSFPSVKYLEEKIQGRSEARNSGWKTARGDYIAFIDSDVVIERNWVQEMYDALSLSKSGGGQASIIPISENTDCSLLKYRKKLAENNTLNSFNTLKIMNYEFPMINSAACMYLKQALIDVEGFDTSLLRHEDIDLSKRIFWQGYDLSAVETTKSYVYFHGVGWFDYYKREFLHGLYKNDYLRKWSKLSENARDKSIQLNMIHSFYDNDKEMPKELNFVNGVILILTSFMKVIFQPNLFNLNVYICESLRALGLLVGKITSSKSYDFTPIENTRKIVIENVNENSRLVHYKEETIKIDLLNNRFSQHGRI